MPGTTTLDKVFAALHLLVTVANDDSSQAISALAERAAHDPYSAAVLADAHDWLNSRAAALVARIIERLEDDPPSITDGEVRMVLHAFAAVSIHAAKFQTTSDVVAVGSTFRHEARTDRAAAMRNLSAWIAARSDQLTEMLRCLIRVP